MLNERQKEFVKRLQSGVQELIKKVYKDDTITVDVMLYGKNPDVDDSSPCWHIIAATHPEGMIMEHFLKKDYVIPGAGFGTSVADTPADVGKSLFFISIKDYLGQDDPIFNAITRETRLNTALNKLEKIAEDGGNKQELDSALNKLKNIVEGWSNKEKIDETIGEIENAFAEKFQNLENILDALKKVINAIQEAKHLEDLKNAIKNRQNLNSAVNKLGNTMETLVDKALKALGDTIKHTENDHLNQSIEKVIKKTNPPSVNNILKALKKIISIDDKKLSNELNRLDGEDWDDSVKDVLGAFERVISIQLVHDLEDLKNSVRNAENVQLDQALEKIDKDIENIKVILDSLLKIEVAQPEVWNTVAKLMEYLVFWQGRDLGKEYSYMFHRYIGSRLIYNIFILIHGIDMSAIKTKGDWTPVEDLYQNNEDRFRLLSSLLANYLNDAYMLWLHDILAQTLPVSFKDSWISPKKAARRVFKKLLYLNDDDVDELIKEANNCEDEDKVISWGNNSLYKPLSIDYTRLLPRNGQNQQIWETITKTHIKEIVEVFKERYEHVHRRLEMQLKNSIVAILVDSFSHNISAHALAHLVMWLTQGVESSRNTALKNSQNTDPKDMDLTQQAWLAPWDDRNKVSDAWAYLLFKYMAEKAGFWAGTVRSLPGGSLVMSWKDLVKGFAANPLLLSFIAESEGFTKVKMALSLSTSTDAGCAEFHVGRSGKKDNRYETMNDTLMESQKVWLPGGLVGLHAFYTIIENEIRNVKHYQKTDGTVNLHIHVDTKNDKWYKVSVWLEHKCEGGLEKEKARIDNRMKEPILEEDGSPRLGGTSQLMVCSSYLATGSFLRVEDRYLKFEDSEDRNHDDDRKMSPWIDVQVNKDGYLAKTFYMWKASEEMPIDKMSIDKKIDKKEFKEPDFDGLLIDEQGQIIENLRRAKVVMARNEEEKRNLRKLGVVRIIVEDKK